MLRFFEPEVEPRWPFSGAPQDHYKCSRMRDDSVFPLQSPSLLAASTEQGSSASSELERVDRHIHGGFNSSQFESFSSSPPLNQIQGQASLTMNKKESRVSGLITSHQDHAVVMPEAKKQRKSTIIRHQIIDEGAMIMRRESKRYKTEHGDTPTMKAPATTMKKSQKLGDKITALQQLVSPFGKTDTASVLQEACVYIKVLHEEIRVLSFPYRGAKSSPVYVQGNAAEEKLSLRGRGLCLVPISSTIMNLTDQDSFDDHRTL